MSLMVPSSFIEFESAPPIALISGYDFKGIVLRLDGEVNRGDRGQGR